MLDQLINKKAKHSRLASKQVFHLKQRQVVAVVHSFKDTADEVDRTVLVHDA